MYTTGMDRKASRAMLTIRAGVGAGHFLVLAHFRERLAERGLVWSDVLAVLDEPADVHDGGADDFGRSKWLVSGTAADGLPLEFVCVLDADPRGKVVVFVTIYTR